jgi:hypothetical protein
MRKQGYRPSTIRATIDTLKAVAKKTNLLDPETVKMHLAAASASVGRKEKICQDLARFYKVRQIPFQIWIELISRAARRPGPKIWK